MAINIISQFKVETNKLWSYMVGSALVLYLFFVIFFVSFLSVYIRIVNRKFSKSRYLDPVKSNFS